MTDLPRRPSPCPECGSREIERGIERGRLALDFGPDHLPPPPREEWFCAKCDELRDDLDEEFPNLQEDWGHG